MRLALPMLVCALLAPPAYAEPAAVCGLSDPARWDQVAWLFAGDWEIRHHAGFVRAGPTMIPFPASGDSETMTITFLANGDMIGTHPDMQRPLQFEWAEEPPWTFGEEAARDGIPSPLLTSQDIENVMGCPITDMARLIGRTTATMDGVTMDMIVRLMVTSPDQMYGIFNASAVAGGTPIKAWRAVTLNRR
jgi:hypothetical protein